MSNSLKAPAAGDGDQGQIFDADLAAIDFSDILGGPMAAAINAQAQSAMVTLEFINRVGFTSGGGSGSDGSLKANEVTFTYSKNIPGANGTNGPATGSLTVPLLSMVPIPYIRVQQLSVDLNVKLNSVQKSQTSNNIVTNTTVGDSSSGFLSFFDPVNFNTTIASKNNSSTSSSITESYDLNVKLLAVQDQMPGGLAKVLQILQDSMDGSSPVNSKS